MTKVNQLFRVVSIWRDFNQNQLIETYNQLFETYQLKNHIDLHRLRLNQISKQNSEHKQSRGVSGFWGTKMPEVVKAYTAYPQEDLQELKAAKEVLISSLKNVHDLELESRKVPKLEAQIHQLENKIARKRSHFYSQQLYYSF